MQLLKARTLFRPGRWCLRKDLRNIFYFWFEHKRTKGKKAKRDKDTSHSYCNQRSILTIKQHKRYNSSNTFLFSQCVMRIRNTFSANVNHQQ